MFACRCVVGGILFGNPRDHWQEESADHEDSAPPFCTIIRRKKHPHHEMKWHNPWFLPWSPFSGWISSALKQTCTISREKKTKNSILHYTLGLSSRRTLSHFAGQSLFQGSVWPLPVKKSSETEIKRGELTSHVTGAWRIDELSCLTLFPSDSWPQIIQGWASDEAFTTSLNTILTSLLELY